MEKNWEKRSIPVSIILSIVTCGLYGLYWYYKLTNDTHQAVGRKTTASGGRAILFTIITCGIYSIYWAYKMGELSWRLKKPEECARTGICRLSIWY